MIIIMAMQSSNRKQHTKNEYPWQLHPTWKETHIVPDRNHHAFVFDWSVGWRSLNLNCWLGLIPPSDHSQCHRIKIYWDAIWDNWFKYVRRLRSTWVCVHADFLILLYSVLLTKEARTFYVIGLNAGGDSPAFSGRCCHQVDFLVKLKSTVRL